MSISLITTCFNSADTIGDTFTSVLEQSYTDYEYIVVDGGSTDGTLEVIRRYEPLFEGRLHWSSEPDLGIYDAMNKGIHKATGDVIGFLNSDDFFQCPESVGSQMKLLEKTHVDAVYADVCYVTWNEPHTPVRLYSSRKFSRDKMRWGYMPAHPTFFCKKEIYEKYGCFDLQYKIAADFELLLRFIYIHHIRTIYNPYIVVKMRTGGASSKGLSSHTQIMRDHLKAFHEHHIPVNPFLILFRYIDKIGDLIKTKWKRMY